MPEWRMFIPTPEKTSQGPTESPGTRGPKGEGGRNPLPPHSATIDIIGSPVAKHFFLPVLSQSA